MFHSPARFRAQCDTLTDWGRARYREFRRLPSTLPVLEQTVRRQRSRALGRPSRSTKVSEVFDSGAKPPWPQSHEVDVQVRPDGVTFSDSGAEIRVSSQSVSIGEPGAVPNPVRAIDRPGLVTSHGRGELVVRSLPVRTSGDFERLAGRAARRRVLRLDLDRVDHADADSIMALAARGIPMWMPEVRRHEQLRAVAGDELCELLRNPVPGRVERARRSTSLARTAFALHSPRVRMAQVEERLGIAMPTDLGISVLLSTRRPTMISSAVDMIAQQRVGAQLIIGLHGSDWSERHEHEIRDRWSGPLEIVRFDHLSRLGTNLNELARRADGRLLTKWDDDDWYGRHHLLDLAQAHEWSGADIVGKAAEYIWLAEQDLTVVRSASGAQTYSRNLAGGTLMLAADTLREMDGFPDVARSVDRLLIDRILDRGGCAYRTHGHEYVLRRGSTAEHTWDAKSRYFLDDAVDTHTGLATWAAGIGVDER